MYSNYCMSQYPCIMHSLEHWNGMFPRCVRKLCKYMECFVCTMGIPALLWRHNGRDGVSNHQPHDCLRNRLFRRRSKKTLMLRVTGLCAGNSPVTGEFPAQMASNAEYVSIWWRHHGKWRNWVDSLLWRHLSVKESHLAGHFVVQKLNQASNKETIKAPNYWIFVLGIHNTMSQ